MSATRECPPGLKALKEDLVVAEIGLFCDDGDAVREGPFLGIDRFNVFLCVDRSWCWHVCQ